MVNDQYLFATNHKANIYRATTKHAVKCYRDSCGRNIHPSNKYLWCAYYESGVTASTVDTAMNEAKFLLLWRV